MIKIDIDKARTIAHDIRRGARAAEFAPLDLKANIPMYAAEAEAERQLVRDKYADIQDRVDAATSLEELKSAIGL